MKRELKRKALRYGLAALLFANTWQVQAQTLDLTLNPARSNGFAAWNEDVVSSTLFVYEKVGSVYNLVTQTTTSNKYVRISPEYFNTPNYYYRIVGTRANSTTVETGYVPALPEGGSGYTELERKVCNGKWYAYEFAAFTLTGSNNVILRAESTNHFYDPNTLVWFPYFQAIDSATWSAIPSGHPYKAVSGGVQQYRHINLASFAHEGGFFDRMNNPVANGWLVEKKFDEFIHFQTASTRPAASFPITFSPPMTGVGSSWVGFFNNYLDTNTFNGTPAVTVFAPTIPAGLECVDAYTLPDPVEDDDSNWNEWVTSYQEAVRDLEAAIAFGGGAMATAELEDLIHTIFIDTTEDVYTTGITFKKHNADQYINLTRDGNELDVHSVGSSIPAGLYEVNVFSNKGIVVPLYMDIKYAVPFSPLKDYADLLITPNPIVSNDLTLRIRSSKPGPVTVRLYDINNNLLYRQSVPMSVEEIYKHFDITWYTLPSNQIIVKVSFADGSYLSVTGVE